jgi:hypothetical protein
MNDRITTLKDAVQLCCGNDTTVTRVLTALAAKEGDVRWQCQGCLIPGEGRIPVGTHRDRSGAEACVAFGTQSFECENGYCARNASDTGNKYENLWSAALQPGAKNGSVRCDHMIYHNRQSTECSIAAVLRGVSLTAPYQGKTFEKRYGGGVEELGSWGL